MVDGHRVHITRFLSTLSLRRATRRERCNIFVLGKFLSTLSLRRATLQSFPASGQLRHFYPRSPCGERPTAQDCNYKPPPFLSTLSLRRATPGTGNCWPVPRFLSTLSLRRATAQKYDLDYIGRISIHALLAESDRLPRSDTARGMYFYPRSPCGERLKGICFNAQVPKFLSTLSLRRATCSKRLDEQVHGISIHALLAESDPIWGAAPAPAIHFYPRSPCGERRRHHGNH